MQENLNQNLSQHIRPYRFIPRKQTRQITVGGVKVGGGAPIAVQTMTNTPTGDVKATVAQIQAAAGVGADLVRVSCPDQESTTALKQIVKESPVPIIADIHFHYRRAIEAAKAGAACLRINPGNIGSKQRVAEVVSAARDAGASIRIGVNGGSLERHLLEKYGEPCPEALVESACDQASLLQDLDFHEFKLSLKASDPLLAIAAYRQVAEILDVPLHLGVTEAGGMRIGTVKSSIGIGLLLFEGIGDTLRVSLSAPPEEEVRVGFDILKSLGLRHRGVNVVACPSCARQQFDVIATVRTLEDRLSHIHEPITLSVIGCVVNGPGEAKLTDVGLTGGGRGTHMVYRMGKPDHRFIENKEEGLIDHLVELVEERARLIREQKTVDKLVAS